MNETLYRHRPDESLDDQFAALPLELAEDFSLWSAELEENLMSFTAEELKQFYGEEEGTETVSLKEQYNLPFEPEQTIRAVGSIGLTMVMVPDAFRREIEKGALDAVAEAHTPEQDEKPEAREAGVSFAQDSPDYQEFVAQAQSIVYNLRYGDESGLGALPPEFQEALSVRMSQRLQELDDGTMSDGEFGLEVQKMISVACIGLRKTAKPDLS